MSKIECEAHRAEMELIKQIATDIGNVKKDVGEVKGIVTKINSRVRDTEIEAAAQGVKVGNNEDDIKSINKKIWGITTSIIAGLFAWIIKTWVGE